MTLLRTEIESRQLTKQQKSQKQKNFLATMHHEWRVVMSWKGDSQATAPIGRKASTNVMPVLESIQNQEILALNHALKGYPLSYLSRYVGKYP